MLNIEQQNVILWIRKYRNIYLNTFVSSDPLCTASSECISGEGCGSAGYCGTHIYSLGLSNCCHILNSMVNCWGYENVQIFNRIFLYLQILIAQPVPNAFLEKDVALPGFVVRIFIH